MVGISRKIQTDPLPGAPRPLLPPPSHVLCSGYEEDPIPLYMPGNRGPLHPRDGDLHLGPPDGALPPAGRPGGGAGGALFRYHPDDRLPPPLFLHGHHPDVLSPCPAPRLRQAFGGQRDHGHEGKRDGTIQRSAAGPQLCPAGLFRHYFRYRLRPPLGKHLVQAAPPEHHRDPRDPEP